MVKAIFLNAMACLVAYSFLQHQGPGKHVYGALIRVLQDNFVIEMDCEQSCACQETDSLFGYRSGDGLGRYHTVPYSPSDRQQLALHCRESGGC